MEVRNQFTKYVPLATLGSLLVGYGIREFLRATGGGYYCCNHLMYQFKGTIVALIGWWLLLSALYGPSSSEGLLN
jgi:hypothetical protein